MHNKTKTKRAWGSNSERDNEGDEAQNRRQPAARLGLVSGAEPKQRGEREGSVHRSGSKKP